jgi:hypothetical protein
MVSGQPPAHKQLVGFARDCKRVRNWSEDGPNVAWRAESSLRQKMSVNMLKHNKPKPCLDKHVAAMHTSLCTKSLSFVHSVRRLHYIARWTGPNRARKWLQLLVKQVRIPFKDSKDDILQYTWAC